MELMSEYTNMARGCLTMRYVVRSFSKNDVFEMIQTDNKGNTHLECFQLT